MVTFDSFLNFVIPIIVLFGGLFLFYRALKEPIDTFFNLVKGAAGWTKGKVSGNPEEEDYLGLQYE